MNLEDFKAVYADETPQRYLRLLVDALDHKGNERVEYVRTDNPEVKEWCSNEVKAMDDRAEWIWDKLMDYFDGPYGKYPKKPQVFNGLWAAKNPGGLVYKRDIVHAISNSDQYPFQLWGRAEGHEAEQDAQTETINAVIATIERCPVYEDQTDPDTINRYSLIAYLIDKLDRYGNGSYGATDMLRDVQDFGIGRRRMDTDGNQ